MNTKDQTAVQQETVTLFVKVAAKTHSVAKALGALLDDVNGARTEAGNLTMEFYKADGQPNTFYLFERWKSKEELESHFAQPYTAGAFDLQKSDLTEAIQMNYLTSLIPLSGSMEKEVHRRLTTLIVPFETIPGCADEFVKLFKAFVPSVRKEPGNVQFDFFKVNETENRFVLYERWEDQDALNNHNSYQTTIEMVDAITPLLTKKVYDFVLFVNDIS
jgi:quinol monooxygenase YgiN